MPIIWKVGTGDLCTLLVANYREATGTIIGLSYQVTVAFGLKVPPSDRGISYQVTVDNLAHPGLLGGSGSSRRACLSGFLSGAVTAIRPFTGGRL